MNVTQKRFVLFLFGCIVSRILFMLLSKYINIKYLPILGYIALIPAIGFTYIFLTNSRKTGPEVFGNKIWWNYLRPVHALLYGLFAYFAINKKVYSWIFLLIDVIIGLCGFLLYHYMNNDFQKL